MIPKNNRRGERRHKSIKASNRKANIPERMPKRIDNRRALLDRAIEWED